MCFILTNNSYDQITSVVNYQCRFISVELVVIMFGSKIYLIKVFLLSHPFLWLLPNKNFIHHIHPNKHTARRVMPLHTDGTIPSNLVLNASKGSERNVFAVAYHFRPYANILEGLPDGRSGPRLYGGLQMGANPRKYEYPYSFRLSSPQKIQP